MTSTSDVFLCCCSVFYVYGSCLLHHLDLGCLSVLLLCALCFQLLSLRRHDLGRAGGRSASRESAHRGSLAPNIWGKLPVDPGIPPHESKSPPEPKHVKSICLLILSLTRRSLFGPDGMPCVVLWRPEILACRVLHPSRGLEWTYP